MLVVSSRGIYGIVKTRLQHRIRDRVARVGL